MADAYNPYKHLETISENGSLDIETTKEEKIKPKNSIFGAFENPDVLNNNITGEEAHDKNEEKKETENNIGDNNSTAIQENLDKQPEHKLDEKPLSPLVESMVKSEMLTFEEGALLKEALANTTDPKKSVIGLKFFTKKKEVIQLLEHLDKPETKKNNREVFNVDFNDKINILKDKNPKNEKNEKELSLNQQLLIDKLGANYFPIGMPGKKGETLDEGMDKSFKMTLNEIIDGKQFPRNDIFTEAVIDIKTGTFSERFKALEYVNSLVTTSQGISGKHANKSFNKINGEHKEKNENLDFRFNEFKNTVKKSINENNELKLEETKVKLTDFKEELPKGGVIESGVIDLIKEINEFLGEQA